MLSPTVGRPKKPPTDKVGVRIPLTEIARWKEAALRSGLSLNAFVARTVKRDVDLILGPESRPQEKPRRH